MNFIWFTDEYLFTIATPSNSGGTKSGVSRARNSTIWQALCAGALWNVTVRWFSLWGPESIWQCAHELAHQRWSSMGDFTFWLSLSL